MHFTSSIVVGIEQISILRVDRGVIRQSFFDDESFKKPTGVREMPFRRTHLRNGLDDTILRLKSFTKIFAQLSNATVGCAQVIRPIAWLILARSALCCRFHKTKILRCWAKVRRYLR